MPIDTDAVISVCTQLSEQENLRVTVRESAKGAAIVGGSAFAGGLLGGPVGLCVAGIAGSLIALSYGKGKYRAVADVILFEMTTDQKNQLVGNIQRAVRNVTPEDLTVLLPLLLSQAPLREMVIREVIRFMQNEMSMSIVA